MCLCNGTGSVTTWHPWGIEYDPCPDSNCQFDRAEADRRYEDWKLKVDAVIKNNSVAV